MNKVPLTARGAAKLQEELKRLKSVDRPRIIQAIAEAREHGDLKENADVTALKPTGKVVFGATVELMDLATDEETTYQIVGDDEADIKSGLVSISSPIARALIGKSEGDEVTVVAPAGEKQYEIVEVRYV